MQYQLGVLENGDIHRMAVYLGIFGCWIVLNHVKQCETIGFRTEPSFSDATDSSLEPSPSSVDYVWLQGTWNISGWWFQPLWKIWKSVGIIIPNLWKNKNVPNHQPDIVGQPEQDSQAASRCVTLGTVGTEKWDKMGNYTQQKKTVLCLYKASKSKCSVVPISPPLDHCPHDWSLASLREVNTHFSGI